MDRPTLNSPADPGGPSGDHRGASGFPDGRGGERLDAPAKTLLALVFVLIATTFVVYWPEMTSVLGLCRFDAGAKIEHPSYFLFRLPREVMSLGLFLFLGYFFLSSSNRQHFTPRLLAILVLAGLWASLCAGYTVLVGGQPLLVPLLGLRTFQYVPLVLAGYILARRYGRAPLLEFSPYVRGFVSVALVIAAVQMILRALPPGVTRPRALGASPNFNTFGATLVACCLWLVVSYTLRDRAERRPARHAVLMGGCLAGALATGSRSAMALCAVVAAFTFLQRLDRRRLLVLAAVPVLVVAIFLAASTPLVSGRPQVATSHENRLRLVQETIDSLDGPAELLVGGGLGLYSSTTVTLLGRDRFDGQVGGAHSSFLEVLGGFGLVGFLGYCWAFWASARIGVEPQIWFFLLAVGLLSLTQPLWGMFPADVLLFLLWGLLVGIGIDEDTGSGSGGPVSAASDARDSRPGSGLTPTG